MKILVTGGSGFLGSSVVPGLVRDGHEVVSTDVREPGEPGAATIGALHVPMDVREPHTVDQVVGEYRPEVVVHLASIVTPGKGSDRALERAVDVDGTRHVLDACRAHGVRRIVVSSSGAAYGYHADNPVPLTECDPLRGNVEFAYADHKRQVEEMLAAERLRTPELEQVVLRIGTILGERVDNQITRLWAGRFILRLAGAESPFVLVWDKDVVRVVVAAVTSTVTGVFNVAGAGTVTVPEIARALGKRTLVVPEPVLRAALAVGKRARLTAYRPEQTVFLAHRPVLDASRLRELGVEVLPTREVLRRYAAAQAGRTP
ncbi:NAD-dependent epimerase/dehydratase family protein [Ornithinimicrobium sufpigmenti]|uniref:NAD-dependent epimerase/dehydratase family protein n=1 Tax=Ornithinimicrobium sufpigmenti TaxID=2508882 RepID=UPI001036E7A6|nr:MULTISPECIES: NAD-dependent epimerase/dehydratase family protein [unclassified Ornithinimicrobium]